MTVVSLYCDDDDDCVITDNDITEGRWAIGNVPVNNTGGVATTDQAGVKWPHQVRKWDYYNHDSNQWTYDPLLTVTQGKLISKVSFIVYRKK